MEVKIVKNEGNEVWIEFENGDTTLPDLIANTMLERNNVEFAGVRKDHPEIGKPLLVIKTKRNVKEEIGKVLEELEEELKGLQSQLSKSK
ncbi:MAG: RpoL/Rpb11 RNA polymerase subunit family protein [Candidatus Micrarchaeia archaeon]